MAIQEKLSKPTTQPSVSAEELTRRKARENPLGYAIQIAQALRDTETTWQQIQADAAKLDEKLGDKPQVGQT